MQRAIRDDSMLGQDDKILILLLIIFWIALIGGGLLRDIIWQKIKGEQSSLTKEERDMLNAILKLSTKTYDMHNVLGDDKLPVWWTNQKLIPIIQDISSAMQSICHDMTVNSEVLIALRDTLQKMRDEESDMHKDILKETLSTRTLTNSKLDVMLDRTNHKD